MKQINIKSSLKSDYKIIQKMREEYESCPRAIKYIKSLNIPDSEVEANITKIYDFVRDIKYCNNCPGLKNCQKENPGICTKISYKNGIIDRFLSPCSKVTSQLAFNSCFYIKDFPDDWTEQDLYKVDTFKGRVLALEKYNKFIGGISSEWIYLAGKGKSGRSYIAALMCCDFVRQKKKEVAFVNCSKRIHELYEYSYKNKELFNQIIDKLSSIPLLVLDDFGNEFKNDFIRDGIIFSILNNRANNKLFTVITSDFKVEQIVDLYSTSKAGAIRAQQIGELIDENIGNVIEQSSLSIYK